MKKISLIVSIIVFSILTAAIVIILYTSAPQTSGTEDRGAFKVGLIFNGACSDRNWGQSHYDALVRLSDELDLELVCRENVPADESCLDTIKELAEDELCAMVVLTSFEYGDFIEKAAETYPDVYFLNAAGTKYGANYASFFGRMYQLRYLSGILAGMQTKTNNIGYIAAFPIPEVIRGINAFTLGVRSVNPDAEVHVSFCDSWSDDEKARYSAELLSDSFQADIIAVHTDSLSPYETAAQRGIMSIGSNYDNSDIYPGSFLSSCVWEWDGYYKEQILSAKQGKFHGEYRWFGIESGLMRLSDLAPSVDEDTINAVNSAYDKLMSRNFDVFYGPITDSDGIQRVAAGESMSDESMLYSFDWYVEGVHVVGE